jgi:ferredoxin
VGCARARPGFEAHSIAVRSGISSPRELVLVVLVLAVMAVLVVLVVMVMFMLLLVVQVVLVVRSGCTRSAWCRPMAHAPSKAFDRGSYYALHCYARCSPLCPLLCSLLCPVLCSHLLTRLCSYLCSFLCSHLCSPLYSHLCSHLCSLLCSPLCSHLSSHLCPHQGATPHNAWARLVNCRGLGTCGTCAVEIEGDALPREWTSREKLRFRLPPHTGRQVHAHKHTSTHLHIHTLTKSQTHTLTFIFTLTHINSNTQMISRKGLRLACQVRVMGDLTVSKREGGWGQGVDLHDHAIITIRAPYRHT